MLGWSQNDLAKAAKVGRDTIATFEAGIRIPYERTLRDIVLAFQDAGIVFSNGDEPGVRLRRVPASTGNGENAPAPASAPRGRKSRGKEAAAAA
jgi:transcriptional regulator with XRE-family HTH domain